MDARTTGLGWPAAEPTDRSAAEPGAPGLGWPAEPTRPIRTHGDGSDEGPAADAAADPAVSRETSVDDATWDSDDSRAPVQPALAAAAVPGAAVPVPAGPDVMRAGDLAERSPLAAPDPDAGTPIAQATAQALHLRDAAGGPTLPRPARTRIMVVANQKGGVGKTTTAVNLAAALALGGLSVLVVDLDPQGNASTALGVEHHADVPSVYDVLTASAPLGTVVQPVPELPGLHCVPATIGLAGAEIELVPLVARESRLRRAVVAYLSERAEPLDYLLIDCPPSLGLLTVNAMVAGDEVLIPIQAEYYALEGVSQLLSNVELIKAHLNPTLEVTTVLLTMYDARTRLAAQVADDVRTHFGGRVLGTAVPRSVRISEAPSYGQTVMTYDPASSGALSYREAARELARRGASEEQPDA